MKRRRTRNASWRTSQAKLKVMRTWTRICGEKEGELEDESGEVEGNEDLDKDM